MFRLTLVCILVAATACGGAQKKSWSEDKTPVELARAEELADDESEPTPKPIIEINPPRENGPKYVGDPLVGSWPGKNAQRMNVDFHQTSIHNALRLFAEVSKLNIVVADEVQGRITMTLKNVPWTEALRAVLKTKDLVAIKEGNVVRVLRLADWHREATR